MATLARDQQYREWERGGWDTTLIRKIDCAGEGDAKRLTAALKARGLSGTKLLDALGAALDGKRAAWQ